MKDNGMDIADVMISKELLIYLACIILYSSSDSAKCIRSDNLLIYTNASFRIRQTTELGST